MKLNLEIGSLYNIMKDFYNVTHVRSSIYDGNYNKILSYPKEHTSICAIMHDNSDTNFHCQESNLQAFKKCRQEQRTIIYTCHLGLSEVVAPLWDRNVIIGYIVFGQITNSLDRDSLIQRIRQKCNEYQLQLERLPEIISHIQYRSKEEIISIAKLLEACTYYIMYHEIVRLNRNGFIMKLDEYINCHMADKISTADLCEEFLMSRTKLYETFNDALNMTIGRYIKQKRIERAKYLLTETNQTISEIAQQTGFGEYNYFCSVFKKEVGLTANQYRTSSPTSASS